MRSSSPPLLILTTALLCFLAEALQPHLTTAPTTAPSTFFYFTRSWSASFCLLDRSADQPACSKASDRFTIHGLWLSCSNGGWPDEDSCPGDSYDSSTVSSLQPALQQQWPSYGDKGNDAFWNHEWTCHGICAGLVDRNLSTQADFFQTVLGLDSQYSLDALAQQLQTTLDQAMPTADLVHQATGILGAAPILTCYYRHGTAYLNSVMSCFSDDLTLVDCQPSRESCGTSRVVVPSINGGAHAHNVSGSSTQRSSHHRTLKSDSRGCAVSQISCSLPGL
ncbi:hypothetical protein WJX73_007710 [Symbiochloris irregularis]|uniref:Uncharacterized protein n=1 Tax=Symbiochloris irregularis TaxID=706552 RepID=A0AAW1P123_9CHLO